MVKSTTLCVVLPLLFAHPVDPVNVAVMVWVPPVKALVLNDACPELLTATFDAKTFEPSANVTDPDGTPAVEVVVEVHVTNCPEPDGLGEQLT